VPGPTTKHLLFIVSPVEERGGDAALIDPRPQTKHGSAQGTLVDPHNHVLVVGHETPRLYPEAVELADSIRGSQGNHCIFISIESVPSRCDAAVCASRTKIENHPVPSNRRFLPGSDGISREWLLVGC